MRGVSNEREVLTYELFGTATRELAQEVADSGFEPDMVLAIARGGLALGMGLGYALGVKNLSVINVEFYTGVDQRLEVPIMLPPTPARVDLSGLKVLIADDVADTGRTLELVHEFCEGHVLEARTVVIYEKPQSVINPTTRGAAPSSGSTSPGPCCRPWCRAPSPTETRCPWTAYASPSGVTAARTSPTPAAANPGWPRRAAWQSPVNRCRSTCPGPSSSSRWHMTGSSRSGA